MEKKLRDSLLDGGFYRPKAPISAINRPFCRQKTRKSAKKRPIVDFFKKNNKLSLGDCTQLQNFPIFTML
ncbi:MAG: hypothetical protein IKW77_04430 [Salinivirgaceae bacterium]|nr:hypothetical protein [Salinivirgaceae bacterium]